VSELCKLNKDQINIDRKEFGVIGKGGRARVVFISDRGIGQCRNIPLHGT